MIAAIAVIALILGGLVGLWLARGGHWGLFVFLLLTGMGAFAWILISVAARENPTGFDGVGEVALAFLVIIPLELGAMIGAGIVLWRKRSTRTKTN